jgi:hypothetical protein
MTIGATLKVKGYVQWDLCRKGFSLDHGEGPNLITTAGLEWIAQRLSSDVGTADDMQYIRAGDGDAAPALTDEDIQGTLWKYMQCGDGASDPEGDQGGTGLNPGLPSTVLWRARFTYDSAVDANLVIREMALCTAIDDSGVCLARFLTGAQGIQGYVDGDEIVVVWVITIGG